MFVTIHYDKSKFLQRNSPENSTFDQTSSFDHNGQTLVATPSRFIRFQYSRRLASSEHEDVDHQTSLNSSPIRNSRRNRLGQANSSPAANLSESSDIESLVEPEETKLDPYTDNIPTIPFKDYNAALSSLFSFQANYYSDQHVYDQLVDQEWLQDNQVICDRLNLLREVYKSIQTFKKKTPTPVPADTSAKNTFVRSDNVPISMPNSSKSGAETGAINENTTTVPTGNLVVQTIDPGLNITPTPQRVGNDPQGSFNPNNATNEQSSYVNASSHPIMDFNRGNGFQPPYLAANGHTNGGTDNIPPSNNMNIPENNGQTNSTYPTNNYENIINRENPYSQNYSANMNAYGQANTGNNTNINATWMGTNYPIVPMHTTSNENTANGMGQIYSSGFNGVANNYTAGNGNIDNSQSNHSQGDFSNENVANYMDKVAGYVHNDVGVEKLEESTYPTSNFNYINTVNDAPKDTGDQVDESRSANSNLENASFINANLDDSNYADTTANLDESISNTIKELNAATSNMDTMTTNNKSDNMDSIDSMANTLNNWFDSSKTEVTEPEQKHDANQAQQPTT